jgi:hypothetical protein
VITNLRIEPGKFIRADQPVYLTVSATEADLEPISRRWSVVSSPPGARYQLTQFESQAIFIASTLGEYAIRISVTDTQGRAAVLTIPIHATMDRVEDVVTGERPCRTGDERLEQFSARCNKAMGGVGVPAFDCDDPDATEPPRQQANGSGQCGAPNVLNQECDPGSHFHVLHRNNNNDGIYIVAHCRKKPNGPNGPGQYGDVAVIQYNSNTGATCFYQALQHGLTHSAPAPISGDTSFWLKPSDTAGINCVRCHDNGPFIRSPYLAQLGEVWPFFGDQNNPNNPNRPNLPAADKNYLPGTLQGDLAGSWNFNMPYKFAGLNFQSWEAYSVVNSGSPTCTGCHRLGVSRSKGTWNVNMGTAQDLGIRATDTSQSSKLAHGAYNPGVSSPIWMTPGQLTFSQSSFNSAQAMRGCALSITNGSPASGCSATRLARGDTCPPPPVVINGSTSALDPKSWKNSGKQPLGQPGGRIGFYYFTAIHGPFYQNSPWDPYVDTPAPVANPPWDPPNQAPSFRGTYLRIYGEPPGQWTVAWGLDATDIQNPQNNPPPPGGPGGKIEGIAFDQIDSVPNPGNCGSGPHAIHDPTGHNSPLTTIIDNPAGGSAAILAGFIGNVSRKGISGTTFLPATLRVADQNNQTLLTQVHDNNPTPAVNQWFTGEAWGNGCANWQAGVHYAAHGVLSTSDVLLVPTADVPNVICYIDGIRGDWSRWQSDGQGGSRQPHAEIYIDPQSGYRLRVWPTTEQDAVSAYATCLYLKN